MTRFLSQLCIRYEQTVIARALSFRPLACWFVFMLATVASTRIAQAQSSVSANSSAQEFTNPCLDPSTHEAIKDAFRLVCSKPGVSEATSVTQQAIVIGFLGGFVKRNDVRHPEVLFVNYLRSRYGPAVHAEVFGNHEAEKALELIRERLDTKESSAEGGKQPLKIILYGHSWGASQVLEFARKLEKQEIPVSLTIQIDSVRKPGQDDGSVPANVSRAVNFYQRKGLTPGRPLITTANAERTTILGNFHMMYKHKDVRCDNYRWLSRLLNKPHHQIENDPHIWDRVATLIDGELSNRDGIEAAQSAIDNSSPSQDIR